MTAYFATAARATQPVAADLSESLELRLVVAGRLSPTALDIHRDRAALAAIVGPAASMTGTTPTETTTEPLRPTVTTS